MGLESEASSRALIPPLRFLLTAVLLTGVAFPLYLLMQFRIGEWLDVFLILAVWLAVVFLYWLPVGAFLFRWRGRWLTRLFAGYVVSLPFYFLTVWLGLRLVTASFLPASLNFHPKTLSEWTAYSYPTPTFYAMVFALYLLVPGGGKISRITQAFAAAAFCASWIGTGFWVHSMDSYRWPAADRPRVDIVNARIVDAPHNKIIEGQNVQIENGKIVQIVAANADNSAWPKIDAQGRYLVPGMIDAHVHLQTPFGSIQSMQSAFDFPYFVQSIFGDYAPQRRKFLENGVTTIRDMGGPAKHGFALRAAVGRHELLGPRMFMVGRLVTSPHGHPVSTIWTAEISRQGAILATDRASLTAGLERNYEEGPPDAVKIVYGTIGMANEKISKGLLEQAVAWARSKDLMSLVHIGTTQEANDAADAGATGIEHVASVEDMPDSLISAMLAHHTFADPTFGEFRTALLLQHATSAAIEQQLREKYVFVRKLAAAGVTLTVGTDAPLVPFGDGFQDELAEFAKAGFSPAQILAFATVNNAAYLGKSNELGSIDVGYDADLFLVHDNPLADVNALRKPLWVMLAGQVVVAASSATFH